MIRFALIFLTSFLLSVAYGSTIYINSSFLGKFFEDEFISIFYLIAALINIGFFFLTPKLIKKFRKETLLVFFLFITGLGTLGMALANSAIEAAISFVVVSGVLFLGYYFLDIALEELSSNQHTGAIRGLYWTFLNGGIALGPLIVSLLATQSLNRVYATSSFILLVAVICALFHQSKPHQAVHHRYHQSLSLPFKAWWKKRNIRAATLARLVLEMFFSMMTIYTPIYLHTVLGMPWSELGIIFTIMLIPFVVLEWPAGEAADRLWGEKEMMSVGFLLMGCATLLMPFLDATFSTWLLVLLISRVGASLVEITTESYFFKKISPDDTGIIGIFRIARPVSFVMGSIIGLGVLNFFSMEAVFFVVAVVIFFGMKEALHLRDTL